MSRTLSRHTLITELQDLLCNVATAHASTVEPPESWLEAELTMPQVKAMLVLYHRGSVRIGSVARELCMSKNAATVLLDRLEALAEAARRLGATLHQYCAARGLDIQAGKVTGVITEKGSIRADAVLVAGGSWSSLFCRRHGIRLPQAGVRSTSFATKPAPEVTHGGLSLPDVTLRRRLDGGYTIGLGGRGLLELSPQGLLYARDFWPTLKKRWTGVTMGISRSFFDGPESFANWSFDKTTPFEKHRTLDPPADPKLVQQGLTRLAEQYPALKGLEVAEQWGGLIDSTPDGIPVISAVDPLPGLFLSTGFTGHGFGIGPAGGRLAADIVAGDPPIVDPTPFRYSRMIDGTDLGAPGMF